MPTSSLIQSLFRSVSGAFLLLLVACTSGDQTVSSSQPAPTAANPTDTIQDLYASCGFTVSRINPDNGASHWKFTVGNRDHEDFIEVAPVFAENIVYFSSFEGNLHALDAQTGKVLWKKLFLSGQIWGNTSPPAIVEGVLYVIGGDGIFYALEATTGKEIWQQRIDQKGPHSRYHSAPFVVDKLVIVTSFEGHVSAFEQKTGKLVWKRPIPNPSYHMIQNTASTGIFYVIGSIQADQSKPPEYALFAIKIQDGSLAWQVSLAKDIDPQVFISDNEILYLRTTSWNSDNINDSSQIFALNAFTGRQIWTTSFKEGSINQFVVTNDALYIAAMTNFRGGYDYSFDNSVYALDAFTGKRLWSFRENEKKGFITALFVLDGIVVVGVGEGDDVQAFALKQGKEIWRGDFPRSIGGLTGSGNVLFVATVAPSGCFIHTLKLSDGSRLWQQEIINVPSYPKITIVH